ncbi:MAG: PAS domain S-box protein, partial [Gammaproteobacteria bacterium]|nr:PAS domain S-box protein [Gammaproteobacteria bacterium]
MSLAQRFVQRFASPILILLLAVIIGLTVFYQKVESEQHFLYLDLINQLEKQDEHYRSTLLYRRFQMSENFDELVKVEREIKYLLSQLMIHSDYMGDEYSGRLYRQLDLLRVRFERKEREVSKFKSSRALYNNSILYLPTLSKQTEAYAKFEKSSLPYEAHRVMEDLLAYLMNDQRYSSLALLERFEALQREIESTRGEGGLAVQGAKEVLRHSSLVLNSYTKMEQHLKAALAVGVTAEIDQLRSIHQAGQEEEEERSGRVTQLLFLFVLLLFLGLVLAVGYLRRVHQTLQRSHERTTQVAEEYTTIVNATPSGVGIIDMEGKLVKANPALLEIFGYEAGELLNQPIERLVPERFHGQHQQFRKAFSNNPHTRAMGSGTSTVRGIRKSGVEFPLNIGLSPITLDGASYIMAGVVDTTEFTRLEKAKDEFLASMS